MDRKSTYFDKLDDEEKVTIVTWATRICSFDKFRRPPHPFGLMFDVDGPFFSVMPKVYRKISSVESRCFEWFELVTHLRQRECAIVPMFARHHDICACLGPTLKEVELNLFFDDVLVGISKFCKSLKSLKLDIPVRTPRELRNIANIVQKVLSQNAQSLEVIQIGNSPENSSWNLMFADTLPNLKSLSLSGIPSMVHTIWSFNCIGGKLEKLLLDFEMYASPLDWESLFQAIRAKWSKLYSIHLAGSHFPRVGYEDLLISYGHQLRHTNLALSDFSWHTLSASICRLAQHCPKLELEAGHFFDAYEDPLFLRLTPHITEIKLECNARFPAWEDRINGERFEAFANRLEKVKKVAGIKLPIRPLRGLFATPKHMLEILELRLPPGTKVSADFVGLVKNSVSNLVEFSFDIEKSIDVSLWCDLLPHCSNLERIFVQCNFIDRVSNVCDQLLRSLRECKKIESISIDMKFNIFCGSTFKNEIKSIQYFRFRPVRINLCGSEMFVPPQRIR